MSEEPRRPHGTDIPPELANVQEAFEEFGRRDAFYAAVSRRGKDQNRWDPAAFYETGREHIAAIMQYLQLLRFEPGRDRAMDFGCGAGRLTQALAEHFAQVTGVDIAESMVKTARAFNAYPDRVQYVLNTAADLAAFPTGAFDLVYTTKVLQHLSPALQEGYIAEFVRLLRPGGAAIFQLRCGPRVEPGTVRAWLYTLNRRYVRRLTRRLAGKPEYEMHFLARARVEEVVARAGGRVLDVVDLSRGRAGRSLRFCAIR